MADHRPPLTDFHRKLNSLLDDVKASRGQSQSDVATLIGRHPTRISKWKNGKGEPTPSDLAAIVEALGCTYDYLCDSEVHERDGISEFNPLARRGESCGLNEKQRMILELARRIGEDEAIDRILNIPGHGSPNGLG